MIPPGREYGIGNIVVVGSGEVTRERVRPAIRQLGREGALRRAVYLDILPECPLDLRDRSGLPGGEDYERIPADPDAAARAIAARGLDGEDTLVYVATPTRLHVPIARHLLSGTRCRIAVEKPFALDPEAAARLLAGGAGRVFPLGHHPHKRPMRWLLGSVTERDCRRIARLEFDLLETIGIGERDIDDAIPDVGWHGFECMLAVFRAAGLTARITVARARTATYEPLPGMRRPPVTTVARVEGLIGTARGEVPFVVRAGKGMPSGLKRLVISMRDGGWSELGLGETGWGAHARMLRGLVTLERPPALLTPRDVFEVVRACDVAGRLAIDEGSYPFASAPSLVRATGGIPA